MLCVHACSLLLWWKVVSMVPCFINCYWNGISVCTRSKMKPCPFPLLYIYSYTYTHARTHTYTHTHIISIRLQPKKPVQHIKFVFYCEFTVGHYQTDVLGVMWEHHLYAVCTTVSLLNGCGLGGLWLKGCGQTIPICTILVNWGLRTICVMYEINYVSVVPGTCVTGRLPYIFIT